MKIVVDAGLCEGNGRCEEAAPEVFAVREDQAVVLRENPSEDLRPKVENAVRLCPRQAISIVEER